jgi:hypothetical protein
MQQAEVDPVEGVEQSGVDRRGAGVDQIGDRLQRGGMQLEAIAGLGAEAEAQREVSLAMVPWRYATSAITEMRKLTPVHASRNVRFWAKAKFVSTADTRREAVGRLRAASCQSAFGRTT